MREKGVGLMLCMIVRNEAAVITRCLDSVLPHVDGFVIADTGSGDATIELIGEAADRHHVAGDVYRHEWRDFGHNRTAAAEAARAWVAEREWPADSTYLLFLDADMVLHVGAGFDRSALSAAAYDLLQDDGKLRYWNTRLARLSLGWRAVGVTHEYWQAVGDHVQPEHLDTMWIEDCGDGGSKGAKFARDIRLLSQALRREPNNPRYVLYLAQSYFDVGRWAEAERLYARRWALGGWDEERWFARYRQGWCLLRLGDSYRAAGVLLAAFDERPSRAEPLWLLARHYRDNHQNHAALMVALRGLGVPYPDGDFLFVDKQVYEWMLWEEVMISAFYAGARYHDIGFSACERLLARRGHEPSFYAYVARNESFYIHAALCARQGPLPMDRVAESDVAGLSAPVSADANRYAASIPVELPAATLAMTRYPTIESDGTFPSRYVTVSWNPGRADAERCGPLFDLSSAKLPDSSGRPMENVRWTTYDDRVWFTATYHPVDAGGIGRLAIGRMNDALDGVERIVGLTDDQPTDCRTDWVPWARGGELCVIAGYDPFVVLRADASTARLVVAHVSTPGFRAAGFRGSTAPIPVPDRPGVFVALVHEITREEAGDAQSHRWIEISVEAGVVGCSRPFFFESPGLERATGLCAIGGGVLATYESGAREPRWMTFEWPTVLDSLTPGETSRV